MDAGPGGKENSVNKGGRTQVIRRARWSEGNERKFLERRCLSLGNELGYRQIMTELA